MRIDPEIKLDFKDVLIRPKRSTLKSRSEVQLERSFVFPNATNSDGSHFTWKGVPIFASNMDSTGTFEMAKELSKHKVITAIHKHYTLEEWREFPKECLPWVAISMGILDSDLEKVEKVLDELPINMIMIDVANGYTEIFVERVKMIRKKYPHKVLIAGNVCTSEMVEELVLSGADIVKVGIGPGSVCTTRKITGCGYPQLSSIIECADGAHGLKGLIIADGGCTVPGDLAKAFGAGADFVMLGGMLSGHKESGGTLVERDGKQYKEFYGMSSKRAMDKYSGGVNKYRASEGKAVLIPYKGDVEGTILEILGGIRSACTYVGAQKLKEISKRKTFVRVTQQINNIYK